MDGVVKESWQIVTVECPESSTLERLPTAAVVLDEQGRVIFANGEAVRFLGLDDSHDGPAPDFHELVHPSGCGAGGGCLLRETLCRGVKVHYEEDRFRNHRSQPRAVYFSVSPLQVEQNEGTLIIFGDISASRDLRAYRLAMDRMTAVGTLAAGMAHEINNPLAFVRANIDFTLRALERRQSQECQDGELLEQPDDQALSEALSDVLDGLDRVGSIVEGLKVFVDDGEAVENVDAEHCLSNALVVCSGRLEQVASVQREGPPLGRVWGNEARLARVFVNLLCNAADAIEEVGGEGLIQVVTGREGKRQYVEIIDDGVGLSVENQKRIFDPFFTLREAGGGTGLGLYISHNFVNEMKGELTVRSRPGQGSTFRVELPLGK